MSRLAFILLLVLLQTAHALPPPEARVQTLRNLEGALSRARFSQICPIYKSLSAGVISNNLVRATACNNNDLPAATFNSLRERCNRRAELKLRCRENGSERACENLARVETVCARIGFTRETRRYCARIMPLERSLSAVRDIDCPVAEAGVDEFVKRLSERGRRLANSIRVQVGLPRPAYEVSIVDPLVGPATSVIVLLHGFQGSIGDWDEVVALARARGFRRTRFVIPQAPVQRLDVFDVEGASWFNIISGGVDGLQATEEVIEAAGNVANLMDLQHVVHGIPYEKMGVMGFSQGSGLALTVHLRHRVGAVVGFSGYLPIANTYPEGLSEESADAPLYMFHGDEDMVVTVESARLSADILSALGRNVTYMEFGGESHSLPRTIEFTIERGLNLLRDALEG